MQEDNYVPIFILWLEEPRPKYRAIGSGQRCIGEFLGVGCGGGLNVGYFPRGHRRTRRMERNPPQPDAAKKRAA